MGKPAGEPRSWEFDFSDTSDPEAAAREFVSLTDHYCEWVTSGGKRFYGMDAGFHPEDDTYVVVTLVEYGGITLEEAVEMCEEDLREAEFLVRRKYAPDRLETADEG